MSKQKDNHTVLDPTPIDRGWRDNEGRARVHAIPLYHFCSSCRP